MNISVQIDPVQSWTKASLLLFFSALAVIFIFLFNEIYSYDIWWHVIIGNDILERLSVPETDIYTLAGQGRPYFDSHWFFQVLIAIAHRLAGMNGVQVFVLIIWGVTFLFTYLSSRQFSGRKLSLILMFAVSMACTERFIARPELVTIIMISFYYWFMMTHSRRIFPTVIILIISQSIWTNSHGLFVIGPFMIGCYWFSALLETLIRKKENILARHSYYLIAVIAGTFLSPHGLESWRYAFLLFTEAGPNAPDVLKVLGELSPTFGPASRSGIAFWFYLLLLAGSVASLFPGIRNKKIHPGRLLVVTGLALASLTGRRNIVLFAIVAGPYIAENLGVFSLTRKKDDILALIFIPLLFLWAVFPLSGKYHHFMNFPARTGPGVSPSLFPHNLPDFLNDINFTGNVYNSNFLGGFYLYHSYPRRLPLTDGRWEIYDHDELNFIRSAAGNPAAFQVLAKRYGIKGLLLQHASPEAAAILPWINKTGNWKLVYLDYAASFWVPDQNKMPSVSIIDPDRISSSHPKPRVEDMAMLAEFYRLSSRLNNYTVILEKLVEQNWKGTQTQFELGKTLIKTGELNKAEIVFKHIINDLPSSTKALNELAFLAYKRGDIDQAEAFLAQALSYDKTDKQSLDNLKVIRKMKARSK